MKHSRYILPWLLVIGSVAVCAVILSWFLSAMVVQRELTARIIVGALFIFLLPGALCCEVLRIRALHAFDAIALSFTVTMILEVAILAITIVLGATITLWVSLVLLASVVSAVAIMSRLLRNQQLVMLPAFFRVPRCRSDRIIYLLTLGLLGGLALFTYRWGENLTDLGGEKLVHVMFVRYYYALPLRLQDLGIEFGLTPPNFIHLWEFLLAGWARCVRVDPLPIFHRARFVIPILGLSGMYLLVKMIFVKPRKCLLVFAGVLLLCSSEMILRAECLKWVNEADSTRGVFLFMGTSHHADSALDILPALGVALALRCFRSRSIKSTILFAGFLVVCFLWHARELFQIALYLGVFGLLGVLLPSLRKRDFILAWVRTMVTLAGCAGALFVLSTTLVGRNGLGYYDETAIKKTAMQYALSVDQFTSARNFFNFPIHFTITTTVNPETPFSSTEMSTMACKEWHYDAWFALSGIGILLLTLLGGPQDRGLSAYFFLLWFLALCWNFSMLLIIFLTYSEFFMTTPRLLHIFSYIAIADALVLTHASLEVLCKRLLLVANQVSRAWLNYACNSLTLVLLSFAGFTVWWWLCSGKPCAYGFSVCLTIILVAVTASQVFVGLPCGPGPRLQNPYFLMLGTVVFLAPFLGDRIRTGLQKKEHVYKSGMHWFDDENPFGLSHELIAWVQALPTRQKILINPTGNDWLFVYAPHYCAVIPCGSILRDNAVRNEIREGRHPLYSLPESGNSSRRAFDHNEVLKWLASRQIAYIVVNKELYNSALRCYFTGHDKDFEIVFDNPTKKEIVLRRIPTTLQ